MFTIHFLLLPMENKSILILHILLLENPKEQTNHWNQRDVLVIYLIFIPLFSLCLILMNPQNVLL